MTSRALSLLALAGLLAGCGSDPVPVIEPPGDSSSGGASPAGPSSGGGLVDVATSTGYPEPCSGPECTGVARLATGIVRCAVRKNGDAVCWGGPLSGDSDSSGDADPYEISDLHDAVAAAAGNSQTCFLRTSGRVACLGIDGAGEVGSVPPGGQTSTPLDVPGVEGAVEIAAGTGFSCARLASGKVLCWGDARLVGAGLAQTSSGPIAVLGLDDAVSLAADADHACAAKKNGKVVCWGKNFASQLGDGTTIDHALRVTVRGVSEAVEVSTGWDGGCARLLTGRVLCWGDQISVDPATGSVPAMVGVDDAVEVGGSSSFACALRVGGEVVCRHDATSKAAHVYLAASAFQLAVGAGEACAALTNGEVWCWSGNTPTRVNGL